MNTRLRKLLNNLLCRAGHHDLVSYQRARLGNRYFHAASCFQSDYCRGRIHYYNEPRGW